MGILMGYSSGVNDVIEGDVVAFDGGTGIHADLTSIIDGECKQIQRPGGGLVEDITLGGKS
jgi:hypothetical protein